MTRKARSVNGKPNFAATLRRSSPTPTLTPALIGPSNYRRAMALTIGLSLTRAVGAMTISPAALREPARREGLEFQAAALKLAVQLTRGYPYFLQEWGYHSWNIAKSSPITVKNVKDASATARASLDESFFRVRFDRVMPREKEYIFAMAALGPGAHRSGDIAAELSVNVESVAPVRRSSIKKGMIYSPAHGDTAFTVPMFNEYLLRISGGIDGGQGTLL